MEVFRLLVIIAHICWEDGGTWPKMVPTERMHILAPNAMRCVAVLLNTEEIVVSSLMTSLVFTRIITEHADRNAEGLNSPKPPNVFMCISSDVQKSVRIERHIQNRDLRYQKFAFAKA